MPTTHYLTAATLDGFIADEAHSLEWLFEVPDDESDEGSGPVAEFFAGVGAMAMGASTYLWLVEHEQLTAQPEKWNEMHGHKPCWVFAHRELPVLAGANVRFVQGDVRPVHAELAAAAGDGTVWIAGGGDLAGQFIDAGLLDLITVSIAPVTLGAGAPLLPRRLLSSTLHLDDVRRGGQFVHLTYAVS